MKNKELKLLVLKVAAIILLFFIFNYVFKYAIEKSKMFVFAPKIIATIVFGTLIGLIISLENIIKIAKCEKELLKFSWMNCAFCIIIILFTLAIVLTPLFLYVFAYVYNSFNVLFLVNSILFGHFLSKIIVIK